MVLPHPSPSPLALQFSCSVFLHEQRQRQGFKCRRYIWEVTPGSRSEEQGEWEREGGDPGLSPPKCSFELLLWRVGGKGIYLQTCILCWLRFVPLGTSPSPSPSGCPVWAERLSKEPRGAVQGAQWPGIHTTAVAISWRTVRYSRSHSFGFSDTLEPITTSFIDCFFVCQSLGE